MIKTTKWSNIFVSLEKFEKTIFKKYTVSYSNIRILWYNFSACLELKWLAAELADERIFLLFADIFAIILRRPFPNSQCLRAGVNNISIQNMRNKYENFKYLWIGHIETNIFKIVLLLSWSHELYIILFMTIWTFTTMKSSRFEL